MNRAMQELPKDFKTNNTSEVQIIDYRISNSCIKNKVRFNQNVFSFLLEGTKELFTAEHTTVLKNNSFLALKSGNCIMTERIAVTNQYRSILLFFSDAVLLKLVQNSTLSEKHETKAKVFEVFQYDDYIHHFVESLIKINTYETSLQSILLIPKLEELITYLIHRNGVAFVYNLVPNFDLHSVHFKNIIESNKLNNLTIQELSFLCNRSVSTFKRNFEQHFHTSPIKWFKDKRLEHAVYLLTVLNKQPIEVFEVIGFESLSSFIQAFKSKYATTPKQFQLKNDLL